MVAFHKKKTTSLCQRRYNTYVRQTDEDVHVADSFILGGNGDESIETRRETWCCRRMQEMNRTDKVVRVIEYFSRTNERKTMTRIP